MNPVGSILFSTFFGGHQLTMYASTGLGKISFDPQGNAYVLGQTSEADFPATAPTLGSGTPSANSFNQSSYAFVAKISGDGSRLVYATLIGGSRDDCSGGSHCISAAPYALGTAIAVDSTGAVTIAGATNSPDFPITAGAYQSICPCPDSTYYGFVARISPDGTKLVWSTFLGPSQANGYNAVDNMVVDASGTVYAEGSTSLAFRTTPGVVQPTAGSGLRAPYIAHLSSDGRSLLYGTYLGGSRGGTIAGMALDANGNLWVAGSTTSSDFVTDPLVPTLGSDFAVQLNSNATAFNQIYRLPNGTVTQRPAFDSDGQIMLLARVERCCG